MEKKNEFGIMLQQLIQQAGTKNANISQAVQYDISYISKWISGKMLPSNKNIEKITTAIADCIVNEAPKENLNALFYRYECNDKSVLKAEIYHKLTSAYRSCKEQEKKEVGLIETEFYPELTTNQLIQKLKSRIYKYKYECIAIIDLLALDHETRLLLAGIENGHFSIPENKDIKFSMAINIGGNSENNDREHVYDSIFLIHMLTCLSGIDFKLYNLPQAYGKFIYSVKDNYLLTGTLFSSERRCLSIVESYEESMVSTLYHQVELMINQESLIFRKILMSDLITEKKYIQSIISTDIKWLLGHFTEMLVPDEVFEKVITTNDFEQLDEYRKLHILTKNILDYASVEIMVYESVLSDIVVSGELDFFNYKIELTAPQKIKCIDYILSLLDKTELKIKLVDGGFSSDFQYITNPCMFLSDSICYLRLENKRYKDNILELNDKEVKCMFEQFFSQIWNNRQDVVISQYEDIKQRMRHYRDTIYLMENID